MRQSPHFVRSVHFFLPRNDKTSSPRLLLLLLLLRIITIVREGEVYAMPAVGGGGFAPLITMIAR